MDRDYCLALQLQEQFDNEAKDVDLDGDAGGGGPTVPWKPEKPLSIVDASWETLDPTPDLRAMFLEFNDRFFWGKLSGVEVKWSHRMTLCAGLCSYEGRGGLCSIRLSEPLLKLRPRKDFVETLLHEMIHALLFVTQNNRDRDGHGPEFVKHMNRINKESGTSITVYHNFNDEVDVYRQHWWRCDGPCRTRGPYFGFVKRSMNRAPSALDPWWEDHRRTCGGNYTKVKEPEGYGKKGGKKGANVSPIGKPAISGTRQDVKAFSGRGFVLGGKPPSASDSPGPSSKSSGRPDTPFPPARAGPAVVPAAPQKRKITKTSVANTKAFVNVNGSPVKISEFHGGRGDDDAVGGPRRIQSPGGTKHVGSRGSDSVGGGRGAGKGEDPHRLKQTSIGAFFNNTSAMSSIAESPTRTLTSVTPPAPMNHPNDDTSSSSASPVERPGGASAATPTRKKKRPPGESADVFELFSKKLKTDPEEAEESAASRSYAASSPSAVLMVRCPACQARVPESNINEHLDSCLC